MCKLPVIVMRGAGDLATGVACRLFHAGFRQIVLLEQSSPLAVRRNVCFSTAMYTGEVEVEGIQAVRIYDVKETFSCWGKKQIPILSDPNFSYHSFLRPDIVVDAIMAKKNLGTNLSMAPLVIGLGPGFIAGQDVHNVIETKRGHFLGRVIQTGGAAPNTGVPGEINGYSKERVCWAEEEGIFSSSFVIGDTIHNGEELGKINSRPVIAALDGIIRGILPDQTLVKKGTKIGDIDPRKQVEFCHSVSDKALAIGGGVLEVVTAFLLQNQVDLCPDLTT